MQAESDGIHSIVIGIGINVNQQLEDFPEELREIASSLRIESGKVISREVMICTVLKQLEDLYDLYKQTGFTPIKTLWENYAVSIGKRITATTSQTKITGIALGITDEGVLLIKDDEGQIHSIYSADIDL